MVNKMNIFYAVNAIAIAMNITIFLTFAYHVYVVIITKKYVHKKQLLSQYSCINVYHVIIVMQLKQLYNSHN